MRSSGSLSSITTTAKGRTYMIMTANLNEVILILKRLRDD
jgi:hypothetical protein